MKKITLIISLFILFIQFVSASDINARIYKEAIITRSYIRHNINDWEKIIRKIELYFNDIRKYRNISKLNILNQKTKDVLIELRKKEKLTRIENKAFKLVENLFYRSYIEQQRKY